VTTTIRAHFDGQVLIPEEPVDLPVGPSLVLQIEGAQVLDGVSPAHSLEERLARMRSTFGLLDTSVIVPDEAISRESFYRDDQ
jgi:hypothetical protein